MELKKNDRVIYRDRLGTVMSDIGYCHHTRSKKSYADVLLDGDEHICQIRKDSLKKIEDETANKKYNFDISKINFEEMAEEIRKGFENTNLEFGHKGNKPIQLKRKDIDKKCYEIMGEKTLYICLEELAELQQAITKFLRGKPNMENIEEEIADVEICLEWVKDIIKPNEKHIEAWKDYKYNRMKTRIEKGEMK